MIARLNRDGRALSMHLDAGDIEEFVARAGWGPVDNAQRTAEDDKAIAAIEAKGYAETPARSMEDAKAWWDHRVIYSYDESLDAISEAKAKAS